MKRLFFLPLAFTLLAASPQPGTVKVHEGEPGRANVPHVCEFHVHAFDVTSGTWTITSWPPTGDKTVVASGTGPITGDLSLPNGHYRLDYENPGKHKMFWVECEPTVAPPPVVPPNDPPAVAPVSIDVPAVSDIELPATDTTSEEASNIAVVLLAMLMTVLFAYLALTRARRGR